MKLLNKILIGLGLSSVIFATIFSLANAQVSGGGISGATLWKIVTGTSNPTLLSPLNNNTNLQIPFLGSSGNPCITVSSGGTFATSTCGSGGGVSTSSVNSIIFPLIADGVNHAGVNATSSTVTFNLQGTSGIDPFDVSSSTGVSAFHVFQNGSVAIGTTTPANQAILNMFALPGDTSETVRLTNTNTSGFAQFSTASGDSNGFFVVRYNGSTTAGSTLLNQPSSALFNAGSSGSMYIGTSGAHPITFYTGGSTVGTNERMVITSTGNVAIGTTTPNSAVQLSIIGATYPASPSIISSAGGNSLFIANSTNVTSQGLVIDGEAGTTAAANTAINGLNIGLDTSPNNTTTNFTGAMTTGGTLRNRYLITHNATGTLVGMSNISSRITISATGGSVSSSTDFNVEIPLVNNTSSSISELAGMWIQAAPAEIGTIGKYMGLRCDKMNNTGITSSYCIYNADPGDSNYFAGNIGIGTSTPGQPLVVVGSTTITSLGAGTVYSTASGGLYIGSTSDTGSGTNGQVAYFTAPNTLTSASSLLNNGTVVGVNATSSTVNFNIKGTTTLDPLNIASSSGTSELIVKSSGRIGINGNSPAYGFVYNGDGTGAGIAQFANNTTSFPANSGSGGLGISWNHDAGSADVDLFNLFTNAGESYNFYQTTGSGSATLLLRFQSSATSPGWIDMNTGGASGIGSGGIGVNPWIAYAAAGTQWFSNSSAGDIVYRNTGGKLLFGNTSGNASMILSSDKLGVGTSTPAAKLDVYGTGTLNPFNVSSSSNVSILIVTSGGNVGIGTSTPAGVLSVEGTAGASTPLLLVATSTNASVFTINANGTSVFQAPITSATALQVLNTSGNAIVSVDNTNIAGTPSSNIFTIASSTGSTVFGVDGKGHVHYGGTTPTVSSCGTNPTVVGNDEMGMITTGTAAPTACTLNFASAYNNVVCLTNTSSTTDESAVTATSTTSVTIGVPLGLTSKQIYYQCGDIN